MSLQHQESLETQDVDDEPLLWHRILLRTQVGFDVMLCGETIPHDEETRTTSSWVEANQPRQWCARCETRLLELAFSRD